MKNVGVISYFILAIVYLITLFSSYESVKENLDGWYNCSSEQVVFFVIICLGSALVATMIALGILNEKIKIRHITNGIGLIVLPIFFEVIINGLRGKVESDFQYLMFRTFEGFEDTYIALLIVGIIAFILLFSYNKKSISQ